MGCIYMATNRINGKCYIGKTKHGIESRRNAHETTSRKGGGQCFHKALAKYGFDAFDWEEVYSDVADDDLNRLEIECIAWFGSKVPNGYNLTDGGEGVVNPAAETRARVSKMKKGMKCPWVRKALKGKKLSLEHRHKCSVALKGKKKPKVGDALRGRKRPPFSTLWRKRISDTLKGRKISPDIVAKTTAAKKGKKYPKISASQQGHITSTETRLKISAAVSKTLTGRKHTEEHKAHNRESKRLWWSIPENRERMMKVLKGCHSQRSPGGSLARSLSSKMEDH